MEIVDPSELTKHHHAWLEWLGLEGPPPEPDSWVAVARGFHLDQPHPGTSRLAGQLVDVLTRAGLEARQRTYEFYDAEVGSSSTLQTFGAGATVSAVAVMVHDRDVERAHEIATGVGDQLQEEATEPLSGELSDAELTRQALEAGPPPPD